MSHVTFKIPIGQVHPTGGREAPKKFEQRQGGLLLRSKKEKAEVAEVSTYINVEWFCRISFDL
jgi:hypothetical protein